VHTADAATPSDTSAPAGRAAVKSEEVSFLDFFRRPERPSRTMAAWITGWAAGAAAVIIIALVIVNNHVVGL
jgi:hypothetical protein